jgi:hypothetical protein
LAAAAAAVLSLAGCRGATPAAVQPPDVDPASAAAYAMEHYDANGDGAIDSDEIKQCPPLAAVAASYDADRDEKLSAEEIASRLTRLFDSGVALTNVDCTVTFAGQPLVGATVTFRPVAMLGDEFPSATGTTDEFGVARPAVDSQGLPDNLKDVAAMHPGLYRVEITHPETTIPARYNTKTELGFEMDPSARGGTSPRFALTR